MYLLGNRSSPILSKPFAHDIKRNRVPWFILFRTPKRIYSPRVFQHLAQFLGPGQWLGNPGVWIAFAFQLWMLVDAIRRQEWVWALCIFFFSAFSALLYFFLVYRQASSGLGMQRGFELPGAGTRRRIKELQARIHHLDKARDHLDLADVYFSQGKWEKAEASYRASLERDPSDQDAIAHLGQCLLRSGKPTEAEPLLLKVVREDPRHDYGHTLMALAEVQTALARRDEAMASWKKVLENHGYARARVQYAQLLMDRNQVDLARTELNEVLADDAHAPRFQRDRDQIWIRRAKSLLNKT